jgi:hypothetical protein
VPHPDFAAVTAAAAGSVIAALQSQPSYWPQQSIAGLAVTIAPSQQQQQQQQQEQEQEQKLRPDESDSQNDESCVVCLDSARDTVRKGQQ